MPFVALFVNGAVLMPMPQKRQELVTEVGDRVKTVVQKLPHHRVRPNRMGVFRVIS